MFVAATAMLLSSATAQCESTQTSPDHCSNWTVTMCGGWGEVNASCGENSMCACHTYCCQGSYPTATPTATPTPTPTATPGETPGETFGSGPQVLELTFPGDISTMTVSTTDAIKASITIEVERGTGAGTVASVTLEAGSIKATVAFDSSVTNAQVRATVAMYTTSPMVVTAAGNTMTSTGASSVDGPTPDDSSAASVSFSAACGAAVALAVAMSF